MIVTDGGNTITLERPARHRRHHAGDRDGAKIAITSTGIEIDNGQGASVKLTGPPVSVNDGALEVT